MRNLQWGVTGAVLLVLAGCASPPSTSIHQPMTARPEERAAATTPRNGAIFQAGQNEHPLFEDRHARNIGDILTINVVEVTSASEKSSSSTDHSGSITASSPTITGGGAAAALVNPFGVTASSAGALANKSASAGNNAFTGTITVTVIEVLANGNLLVSGEKQVAINQSDEYVRFSGVINPATITGTNTVLSSQVADAHIEYKGATSIDRSAVMSILGRIFLSVLPF
jgi:flagellar L-ring protein precursor FlgH